MKLLLLFYIKVHSKRYRLAIPTGDHSVAGKHRVCDYSV